MTLKRITASFLAALLICLPAFAQTPAPAQSQKEQKELEKKTLVLLDELVGEAMSLKLVENRIYALTTTADLFWKHNEDRARALLREAVNQFMTIEQPAELDDPRAMQTMQLRIELRTQLLQSLAARDSRMALDFLRASRLPDAGKMFGGRGVSPDFERQFEMQLAIRIAENDPQTALQMAEESLKDGVDHQVYQIWSNLMSKDPKTAAKLFGEIVSAVKSSDVLKNYQSMSVVLSMLQSLRAQMQTAEKSAKDSQPPHPQQTSQQEMRQSFRELLDLVVSAALKITAAQFLDINEQGQARNLLSQVQMLTPDIEKNLPGRAQAVRAKLAQFDKALYRPPVPSDEILEDLAKKSPDELVAMAAKSQNEFKDMYYRQAAAKALEQGDTSRARQIAKDFLPNGGTGDPMIAQIEQAERAQALAEGKLEDARKSISRMRSNEERALALIELATKAEAGKDQKSQQALLKEAGELLGDQMETRAQVEAQLNLAVASLNVNTDRSFEILGSAVDRLNVVLSAVVTLTKFDQTSGIWGAPSIAPINAADVEMRLNAGEFGNFTTNLDQQILAFARKDFDRTMTSLRRWQVNEVRLAMSLSLAGAILGDEKKEARFYPPYAFRERID